MISFALQCVEYLINKFQNLQKPEPGVIKVHVFGEIISAKNFDYDDLHVYYQLELPKSYNLLNNNLYLNLN